MEILENVASAQGDQTMKHNFSFYGDMVISFKFYTNNTMF